jgi:8-oxo-dGTP diphosphatase
MRHRPDGSVVEAHLHPARRMSAARREVIVGRTFTTPERAMRMTTLDRAAVTRQVFFHAPGAPPATVVVPSVFVAARWLGGQLLLVRRCDSGCWELPGGRVDVGESAVDAAVRETAEEAGVQVLITGLAGLFSDPGHVVRSPDGEVRQQFAVLFRARPLRGIPRGDMHETSEAAWLAPIDIPGLDVEPAARVWIDHALSVGDTPHLG